MRLGEHGRTEEPSGASGTEYVCPDPETGEWMPQHFDLEGRLRRCMLAARVDVTG